MNWGSGCVDVQKNTHTHVEGIPPHRAFSVFFKRLYPHCHSEDNFSAIEIKDQFDVLIIPLPRMTESIQFFWEGTRVYLWPQFRDRFWSPHSKAPGVVPVRSCSTMCEPRFRFRAPPDSTPETPKERTGEVGMPPFHFLGPTMVCGCPSSDVHPCIQQGGVSVLVVRPRNGITGHYGAGGGGLYRLGGGAAR